MAYRKEFAGEFDERILFGVNALVIDEHHFEAGVDEKRAKDIEDPVILLHQRGPGPNHHAAHDERAEDTPEEDAMLVFGRVAEISEDQGDDEDVVHRQGKFEE